ncbi:uncharacterized protein K489DRAFT_7520 [Dissoconium aciculare CBS 342.82]|uniref:Uncharacterized protein n=1 Tax=Dissoconium aciculare CBS 342.82 TaxID=1314786 RepID=A0A6J3MJM2_9PEZI|nr:uncharacterized protein K489DRAFT_7520 [Dissoconium aciculare CBS 342.82]KAF1827137.1 hypothetical protein K489DRAFT_7520 [Dissoconium aciculare CBS 342.82]
MYTVPLNLTMCAFHPPSRMDCAGWTLMWCSQKHSSPNVISANIHLFTTDRKFERVRRSPPRARDSDPTCFGCGIRVVARPILHTRDTPAHWTRDKQSTAPFLPCRRWPSSRAERRGDDRSRPLRPLKPYYYGYNRLRIVINVRMWTPSPGQWFLPMQILGSRRAP